MNKSKYEYKVEVKGKTSVGTPVSASYTGIHADTSTQAEKIAKSRCNYAKIISAVATRVK